MTKVNIIYHHFPHYRRPVLRELVKRGDHEYRFWGSHIDFEGIKTFVGDDLVKISPISFETRGRKWIIRGFWPAVLDSDVDVIIVHGHPNMPASWQIAIVARALGKKVIFWAHGWRRNEGWLKGKIRNLHYGLANRTMVYSERAIEIARSSGFNTAKLVPIYNSLDWLEGRPIYESLILETRRAVRERLSIRQHTFRIICVARLTATADFETLIHAMHILKKNGSDVEACLIGDGAERPALEASAKSLNLRIDFLGEIYDERLLGEHIFASDLTVSPGKVGLSAIHSMMYGIPVVSHSDLNSQMPEVNSIEEGVTGSLFEKGNAHDLAAKIAKWINLYQQAPGTTNASQIGINCIAVINERYNPTSQAALISRTITEVLEQG